MDTTSQQSEEEQQAHGPIEAESWKNILPDINARNKDFAKRVGEMVCRRVEDDLKSSAGYRRRQRRYLDLFSGRIPGHRPNEKNILYLHMPLLTKAALKFQTKLHTNFFPARGDITALSLMRPGPDTLDRELAMTRFMNVLMRNLVVEYIPAHDHGSLSTLLYGSAFSIWRWDSALNRPAFEFGTCDQVIVPYAYRSARADMSDVPHYTWELRMHRHEIEAAAEAGDFDPDAVKKLYSTPYSDDGTAPPEPQVDKEDTVQETSDRILGVEQSENAESLPREIHWHHCWLRLPGEKRQRPVEIFVDATSKAVLRISLREKDDPADVHRYEGEAQVYQQTVATMQANYQAQVGGYQNMVYQMQQKKSLQQ